jgi:hypothetical protein
MFQRFVSRKIIPDFRLCCCARRLLASETQADSNPA